jgi:quercetin dioxygenase-like cupin family protein
MEESELLGRLRAEGLAAGAWGNAPGDVYALHRHAYDKVIVCARGSIAFGLPGRKETLQLGAGDRLDLPAGTDHDAVVGPSGVTCLEAHLPAGLLGRDPVVRAAGSW